MEHFEVREDGYNYPEKPINAKTVAAWRREGRMPIAGDCIEYFQMPSDPTRAYAYVRFENTVERNKDTSFSFTQKKNQNEKNKEALYKAYVTCQGNPIVFDTETTGFSPKIGDEILQISITDKDSNILLNTYVRPLVKKYWPDAEKVHGISYDDVKDAPTPMELQSMVQSLFENASAVVGHNVPFDIRFIESTFGIHIPEEKIVDTLKLFKFISKEGPHKLGNAVDYFCPEYQQEYSAGAHDSCTDTIATSKVLKSMADLYEKEYAKEKSEEEDFDL